MLLYMYDVMPNIYFNHRRGATSNKINHMTNVSVLQWEFEVCFLQNWQLQEVDL